MNHPLPPFPSAGPRLTICIPTYNFGAFIGHTLESIAPQLTGEVEVLVVDGASTDNTGEVVRSLQQRIPALRYHRLPVRGGIDRDMAAAVDLAAGEYCWLFSADDIMAPEALAFVLGEVGSGADVLIGQHSNGTRDLDLIEAEHPVLATHAAETFNLSDPDQRRRYFRLAQTSEAFFSFMSGLIVRRAKWQSVGLPERFVGTCWAHVARLLSLADAGLKVRYLARVLLMRRGENDSFATEGVVRRYSLAIDGFHDIAAALFGADSFEARAVRRVIRNEFQLKHFLVAKSFCVEHPQRENLDELNRLAARNFSGSLWGRSKLLAYRLATPAVTTSALNLFRRMRRRILPSSEGHGRARRTSGASLARPIRVLLVTGSYPPMACGVGGYTRRLAEALALEEGVEVAVLTSIGAASSDVPHVTLFPLMEKWRLGEAKQISRVIRDWRPDIVHVQYPTQGYGNGLLPRFVPAFVRMKGARVVRTWHELPGLANAPDFLPQALVPGPFVVVRPNYREQMPWLYRKILARKAGGFVESASPIPKSNLNEEERRRLRARYAAQDERLIAYFGFIYPFKGVELLFEVARPDTDRLVIAGEAGVDPQYSRLLHERAAQPDWAGKVTFTGHMPDDEIADLLAAADAVVLPFRGGGGVWNSSIHAAALQGTPVISTSKAHPGKDASRTIHFTAPDDVAAMRAALDSLVGTRSEPQRDEWQRVAHAHVALYRGEAVALEEQA